MSEANLGNDTRPKAEKIPSPSSSQGKMLKQEKVNEIASKQHVALSFIGAAYILGSGAWIETIKTYVGPGKITIASDKNNHFIVIDNPRNLIVQYSDPNDITSLNIILTGLKDMVTQTYEIVRDYCESTNQLNAFRQLPWYNFSRLIRNSLSHDYKLNFKLKEGKYLPDQKMDFSDKTIEFKTSMHGAELNLDTFPIKYAFELVEMMKRSLIDDVI